MQKNNSGEFIIDDGVLVKYVGGGGNVIIPDGITAVGESAFKYCKSITRLSVPSSVETIGKWAFFHCDCLADVELADGVKVIDSHALEFCGMTRLSLPTSIEKIGSHSMPLVLSVILYAGTVKQWDEIEKGVFWDFKLDYSVVCRDGSVIREK